MKDISDNPMTIKGLILFIAIIFAFTFLGWGIVTVSRSMLIDGVEELAIEVNELKERVTAIEKVVKVKVSAYNPTIAQCDTTVVEYGKASWYGEPFHGRITASGEVYDMFKVSAAHKTLPLKSWVRVINEENGRVLDVRLNDRGPFIEGRIIDLSYAAALILGVVKHGTADVKVISLNKLMTCNG